MQTLTLVFAHAESCSTPNSSSGLSLLLRRAALIRRTPGQRLQIGGPSRTCGAQAGDTPALCQLSVCFASLSRHGCRRLRALSNDSSEEVVQCGKANCNMCLSGISKCFFVHYKKKRFVEEFIGTKNQQSQTNFIFANVHQEFNLPLKIALRVKR